jgi:hypothetical protein
MMILFPDQAGGNSKETIGYYPAERIGVACTHPPADWNTARLSTRYLENVFKPGDNRVVSEK